MLVNFEKVLSSILSVNSIMVLNFIIIIIINRLSNNYCSFSILYCPPLRTTFNPNNPHLASFIFTVVSSASFLHIPWPPCQLSSAQTAFSALPSQTTKDWPSSEFALNASLLHLTSFLSRSLCGCLRTPS